jgi:broad specificity phosphatase PhoE
MVYVIRHLQKATGDDPPLTGDGAAGAQKLSDLLANKKVTAIYATQTKHAMQTAEPLAQRLHLSIQAYDPKDPAALAGKVAKQKGAALIVGHSNTVPELVAKFGGKQPAPLADTDYGTVFVVRAGSSEVQEIQLEAPAKK